MGKVCWAPTRYQVLGCFLCINYFLCSPVLYQLGIVFHCHVTRDELSWVSPTTDNWRGARPGRQHSSLWSHPSSHLPTTGQSFSGTGWWRSTLVLVGLFSFIKLWCARECNPDHELSVWVECHCRNTRWQARGSDFSQGRSRDGKDLRTPMVSTVMSVNHSIWGRGDTACTSVDAMFARAVT